MKKFKGYYYVFKAFYTHVFLASFFSLFDCLSLFLFHCSSNTRDLKKVGVTIAGPQKKIVSSLKALESHTKNGPVPV